MSTDAKLDRLDRQLEGVEGRLQGVEGRLEGVEGRLEGVEGRLHRVETKVDQIQDDLERYATKEDLRAELERYATKEDLRAELERYATKEDLRAANLDLYKTIHEDMQRQRRELSAEMASHFGAMEERMAHLFEVVMEGIKNRLTLSEAQALFVRRDELPPGLLP